MIKTDRFNDLWLWDNVNYRGHSPNTLSSSTPRDNVLLSGAIKPVGYTYVKHTLVISFPAAILFVIPVVARQESPRVWVSSFGVTKKKKRSILITIGGTQLRETNIRTSTRNWSLRQLVFAQRQFVCVTIQDKACATPTSCVYSRVLSTFYHE